MILDDDIGVFGLDALGQGTQHGRLSDTSHILQTDLLCTSGYHLIGNLRVILYGMHRRGGDTECSLGRHTTLLGPLDRRNDITCIVQSAEDTGDIHTLGVLHLIHQRTHIIGHRIHSQSVQTTVEHVGLDTYLIEGLTEGSYGQVGVLACHQVHLLKGTTIGFHAAEAAHIDDCGRNALQLVLAWLELT